MIKEYEMASVRLDTEGAALARDRWTSADIAVEVAESFSRRTARRVYVYRMVGHAHDADYVYYACRTKPQPASKGELVKNV
jgi:hypothetical protein